MTNRPEPATRTAWDLHRETLAVAIESVALGLFDERGYDEVTIEEIAAAAGVSPRTMFRYFKRKADILADVQRRQVQRLVETLLAQPDDHSPVQALHDALLTTSTIAREHRELVLARARVMASTRSVGIVSIDSQRDEYRAIVELIAKRMGVDPDRDLRPRVLVSTMAAAASVAYNGWAAGGCRANLKRMVSSTLRMVEQGLESIT